MSLAEREVKYIIEPPFKGYCETTTYIKNGIELMQYSNDKVTLTTYLKNNPTMIAVDSTEMDRLLNEYEQKFISEPVKIDRARFWEMLEVLPPCRWGSVSGIEVFHVSERYTGEIVSWFAHSGDNYLEFYDFSYISNEDLATKIIEALKNEK